MMNESGLLDDDRGVGRGTDVGDDAAACAEAAGGTRRGAGAAPRRRAAADADARAQIEPAVTPAPSAPSKSNRGVSKLISGGVRS